MKEKTVEFPFYSTKYLDDVIGGDDPDLDPMIWIIAIFVGNIIMMNLSVLRRWQPWKQQ